MRRAAKTTTAAAPKAAPEWRLQAEQVRRLRSMREHGSQFLLVGDMAAGKRGPQAAVIAKATGMVAGHPDVTVFLAGGRCAFIENKTMAGRLSPEQKARHADLRAIGHDVAVVKAATPAEAADEAERLVRGWMAAAANDNAPVAQREDVA